MRKLFAALAITVASMRCAVSDEADEAEAIRASVVLAVCLRSSMSRSASSTPR